MEIALILFVAVVIFIFKSLAVVPQQHATSSSAWAATTPR